MVITHEMLKNQDIANAVVDNIQQRLHADDVNDFYFSDDLEKDIEENTEKDLVVELDKKKDKLEAVISSKSNTQYPHDDRYWFETYLERIDLDKERIKDVTTGNGYIVNCKNVVKKDLDLDDPDGLFSPKFGIKLGDMNLHANRYRCKCGALHGRVNKGLKCSICGDTVRNRGDDYEYFGWMVLKYNRIIHPSIYSQLEFFFGPGTKEKNKGKNKKKTTMALENIICYKKNVDENGHIHDLTDEDRPANQPFYGIGMTEFEERFDEIMDFYLKKYPKKKDYYDSIMEVRDRVFTSSIPVFTTCLRPIEQGPNNTLTYSNINEFYVIINRLVYLLNEQNPNNRMSTYVKNIQKYMYDIQMNFQGAIEEIKNILTGKKGVLRDLISGRFNFTSRAVIIQNPDLRIDQITLPYTAMVIMLEQKIKNVLIRTHNCSPNDADRIWQKALLEPSEEVMHILDSFIVEGVPVLLNRNPTIQYGSILCMYVVNYTMDLTIGVPLQILKFLGADFDGDVLNIFLIINRAFWKRADEIFNPRNAMYISRSNGLFNMNACVQRDTVINANTLIRLGRHVYSDEDMAQINEIRKRQKAEWYLG